LRVKNLPSFSASETEQVFPRHPITQEEKMSQPLFKQDIKFLQRFLKSGGFDPGIIDGDFGPDTNRAEEDFMAASEKLAQKMGTFHPRSEANIITLNITAQKAARTFLAKMKTAGIDVRMISGTRTFVEQDALFAQGRTKPGKKVTNAKGGQSNHNFGIAWDVVIFDPEGRYLPESPLYKEVARIGLTGGLEWGGNFSSFPDQPYFQLATGLSITAVRKKFEKGDPLP
jgi:peptidoglycan L-alanyl-D-glutamate endopeptidase CwlK